MRDKLVGRLVGFFKAHGPDGAERTVWGRVTHTIVEGSVAAPVPTDEYMIEPIHGTNPGRYTHTVKRASIHTVMPETY